jgi:MFS family permease
MFGILAHRTYRHLFGAQALSLLGSGLTTVALALLAYDLAGADAGVVLGTALAIKMIAYVGLSPVAGAFAGRVPRRAFLVTLDVSRAGLVVLLPFVAQVWHIYVLVFLFQACSAAFTPTFQATIPDILRDERDYTRALSLSRLAYDLESLVSPALAALLLTFVSFHWLFAGTTIGFLASAALVLSVALPAAGVKPGAESFRSRVTRGLRIYLATPRLRGLLALSFAVSAAGAMIIVNTVVYVREHLAGSDHAVALFFMVFGGGSMLVALLLPRMLERLTDRVVMAAGAGIVVAGLAAAVTAPAYGGGLLVWIVLGAGTALIQTPSGRLLARSSHEEDRPALYAAHFALSHACWLVTYPLSGWLGAAIGLSATFAVMTVLAAVAGALAMRLWPGDDRMIVEHTHAPQSHEHWHVHDEHHQHTHEGWEGPEPHRHPHRHERLCHSHVYVIDDHHPAWPGPGRE